MKKLFTALFLIILISLSTSANAFKLELKGSQMIFNDRETKAGPGIEVKIKIDGLYGYLSESRIWVYGDWIRFNSVGIGFEYPISKRLHLWGQVGYYIPDYREDQFAAEPLMFYQNKYLHGVYEPVWWPKYTANWESDIGGELGIDYKRQVCWVVLIGLSLSYRYLRLNEMVTSYQSSGDVAWFVEQNRDFGGFKIGLIMAVEF